MPSLLLSETNKKCGTKHVATQTKHYTVSQSPTKQDSHNSRHTGNLVHARTIADVVIM